MSVLGSRTPSKWLVIRVGTLWKLGSPCAITSVNWPIELAPELSASSGQAPSTLVRPRTAVYSYHGWAAIKERGREITRERERLGEGEMKTRAREKEIDNGERLSLWIFFFVAKNPTFAS